LSDGQTKAFELHVREKDAGLHPCTRMPLAWFLLERPNIVSSGKDELFANNLRRLDPIAATGAWCSANSSTQKVEAVT